MDVLLFTNFDLGEVPDNVKVIEAAMHDIYDQAEQTYGIQFGNRFPYKLCDLKSFYSEIFREELEPYEFWGYGDCDVAYGELPCFGEFDLYCGCHERHDMDMVKSETPLGRWFVPGHFVMMRNNEAGRSIMEHLPTGRKLLADGVNRYIDEHLVPTVLRHIFPNRCNIISNDYQYLDGQSIELIDGLLKLGGKKAHYIHFYTHKGMIKTPRWREISKNINVRDYIND